MNSSKIHPSIVSLYAAARLRGDTSPALVARRLNMSAQRLQNWEDRGISKEGALVAQKLYAADANALLEGKFEPMATKSMAPGTPEGDADELRRQVESLWLILSTLLGVTAKHRPLEGEELAQLIRGNQSLDLSRHKLAAKMLDLLEPEAKASAKAAARARK